MGGGGGLDSCFLEQAGKIKRQATRITMIRLAVMVLHPKRIRPEVSEYHFIAANAQSAEV